MTDQDWTHVFDLTQQLVLVGLAIGLLAAIFAVGLHE